MEARRYAWAVVYALIGVALVLFLVGIQRIGDLTQAVRNSQQDRAPLMAQTNNAALSAKVTSKRIEDCTTPGRRCFEQSQKRTAETLGSVFKQNIATAACQVVVSRESSPTTPQELSQQISECVDQTLQALAHKGDR